jgi:hypothetical protein
MSDGAEIQNFLEGASTGTDDHAQWISKTCSLASLRPKCPVTEFENMRLCKSALYVGVAFVMIASASTHANAGGIPVTSDSGSGSVNLSGSTVGLDLAFQPGTTISIINHQMISPALPVTLSSFDFTGTASSLSATATKTITDGTDTVTMTLALGATINTIAGFDFLNVTGTVTSVTESNPTGGTYDWYYLMHAAFAVVQVDMGISDLLGNPGAPPILTTGSFTQTGVLVPEPSSVVLMALGTAVLVGVFRRNRSRRV